MGWEWKGGKGRYSKGEEECVKDIWIESNESREERRHLFHLRADLNRSFIIIIWKMCMLIAQTHLPAGRKDTFHFQRIHSLTLCVSFKVLQCLDAEWGVIKDAIHTHCEQRRVTIIYLEISLVFVPDECVQKLRVKAHNGRLTTQHNKGTEYMKSPSSDRRQCEAMPLLVRSKSWIYLRGKQFGPQDFLRCVSQFKSSHIKSVCICISSASSVASGVAARLLVRHFGQAGNNSTTLDQSPEDEFWLFWCSPPGG